MRNLVSFIIINFLIVAISFGMNSVLNLQKFPDPIFARPSMVNLTPYKWSFQFDKNNIGLKEHWFSGNSFDGTIKLPFPWNSKLSGIGTGDYVEVGWYSTHFNISKKSGVLLNFGAVDYSAMIWINGNYVGQHEGGYTPFSFDISNFVNYGTNTVVVRVFMPKNLQEIPHGKQKDDPPDPWSSVSFKRSCGIWQDVWLEFYDKSYIRSVEINPSTSGKVNLKLYIINKKDVKYINIKVLDPSGIAILDKSYDSTNIVSFYVRQPRFWNSIHPYLYLVNIRLIGSTKILDDIYTYFGFRTIQTKNRLILINDEPAFLKMVLVQGYWSKGIYTPPSTYNFKTDIQNAKRLGFNGLKIHQKIENPKFLFWADVIGMYVWEEVPSFTNNNNISKKSFEYTLFSMVKRDFDHPSVIIWGLFNEEWGIWNLSDNKNKQNFIVSIYEKVKKYDPSRLIVDNSGWDHVKTDITDVHLYEASFRLWNDVLLTLSNLNSGENLLFYSSNTSHNLMAKNYHYEGQPIMVSEFGGGSSEDYIWEIEQLRMRKISGFVYTELYDIEHELAGLYSYDRKPKFDNDVQNRIRLINAPDTVVFNVDPNSIAFWGGKSKSVPVCVSHTSSLKLLKCDLEWSISNVNSSSIVKKGNFKLAEIPYGISKFSNIKFKLPHGSYLLEVKLVCNGSVIVRNWMPLYFLF